MKVDEDNSDLAIDGRGFRIESASELDFMNKLVIRLAGVDWAREPRDIIARLWSEASDAEQLKLERRKETYGMDLRRYRAESRAKGAF